MTTKTKKGSANQVPKGKPPRKFPVLWVVFGAIAVLLVAAIVLSGEESIGSGGEYGDVTVEGTGLPQMAGNAAFDPNDPAFGPPLPSHTMGLPKPSCSSPTGAGTARTKFPRCKLGWIRPAACPGLRWSR